MCALLRIQLHVVAAYTIEMAGSGTMDMDEMGVELLEKLITATYAKIYDVGLKNLTQIVREGVAREMQDWIVREKMSVQYDDLILKLCSLRADFEQDTLHLINALAISPENNDPELLMGNGENKVTEATQVMGIQEMVKEAVNGNGRKQASAGRGLRGLKKAAAGAAGAERSQEVVNELLCRTWDIVDSHVFQSIFNEAVNTSFKHVNLSLRQDTFGSESLAAGASSLSRTHPWLVCFLKSRPLPLECCPAPTRILLCSSRRLQKDRFLMPSARLFLMRRLLLNGKEGTFDDTGFHERFKKMVQKVNDDHCTAVHMPQIHNYTTTFSGLRPPRSSTISSYSISPLPSVSISLIVLLNINGERKLVLDDGDESLFPATHPPKSSSPPQATKASIISFCLSCPSCLIFCCSIICKNSAKLILPLASSSASMIILKTSASVGVCPISSSTFPQTS